MHKRTEEVGDRDGEAVRDKSPALPKVILT